MMIIEPCEMSQAAYRAFKKTRAGSVRAKVFFHLRMQGRRGSTVDEAAAYLKEEICTVSPRFTDLRAAGAIVATGTRRKTRRDNWATVYVLAMEGGT